MDTDSELNDFLAQYVRRHYESGGGPLLLAQLGTALQSNDYSIPGKTSLKQYIQNHFGDALPIVQNPDVLASIAVALPDNVQTVANQLSSRKQEQAKSHNMLDKLSRAMLIAFCRAVPNNQRIFLSTTPPIRYLISPTKPSGAYVEIPHDYRMSGEQIRTAQELDDHKKAELTIKIEKWLRDNELSWDAFLFYSAAKAEFANRKSGNALERLLAAQSDEVKSKMLLPGDIVAILLAHR